MISLHVPDGTGLAIVVPTGPVVETEIHSDTSLTLLYTCYIQLINSERQAIWQRFTAMILANSFIITFLLRDTFQGVAFAISGCGLAISTMWLVMTVRAWIHFFRLYKAAQAFS